MLRCWPSLAIAALAACGTEADDRPATLEVVTLTILAPNCGQVQCHSSTTRREGYAFDTVEGAREALDVDGLKVREAIDAGEPLENDLMYVLDGVTGFARMPPDTPLHDEDIALIETWLLAGAPGVP
jgi:hypothetical protein